MPGAHDQPVKVLRETIHVVRATAIPRRCSALYWHLFHRQVQCKAARAPRDVSHGPAPPLHGPRAGALLLRAALSVAVSVLSLAVLIIFRYSISDNLTSDGTRRDGGEWLAYGLPHPSPRPSDQMGHSL